jgi:hypothetical protein
MDQCINDCITKYDELALLLNKYIDNYNAIGMRYLGQKWLDVIEIVNKKIVKDSGYKFTDSFSIDIDNMLGVKHTIFNDNIDKNILYNVSDSYKSKYLTQKEAIFRLFADLDELKEFMIVEVIPMTDDEYLRSKKAWLTTEIYLRIIANYDEKTRNECAEIAKMSILGLEQKEAVKFDLNPLQLFFNPLVKEFSGSGTSGKLVNLSKKITIYNIKTLCEPTQFKKTTGLQPEVVKHLNSITLEIVPEISTTTADIITFDKKDSYKLGPNFGIGLDQSEQKILDLQNEIMENVFVKYELPQLNNKLLIDMVELKEEISKQFMTAKFENIEEANALFSPKVPLNGIIGQSFYIIHNKNLNLYKVVFKEEYKHTLLSKILQNTLFYTNQLRSTFSFKIMEPKKDMAKLLKSQCPNMLLTIF